MMHSQIAIPMAGLPLQLVLISNGKIGIVKTQQTLTKIFDIPEQPEGIHAVISDEDLLVGDEVYQYGAAYPLTETMKEWLKSLNLVAPF